MRLYIFNFKKTNKQLKKNKNIKKAKETKEEKRIYPENRFKKIILCGRPGEEYFFFPFFLALF